MIKYLLTGDGRRLLTGGGQVLTADAPGPAYSSLAAAPISVSIALSAKVTAIAVAAVAPMAMAFGMTASPTANTGILPMPVSFGLSAVSSAWASAEPLATALEFGMAAAPSATAQIVPGPAAVVFDLDATPSVAYPSAVRPRSIPVGMRLFARPTRAALVRPRSMPVRTALSATISVSTAAKWREMWLSVFGLRQDVLNAIDANNRELAKNAGALASANAAALVQTNTRVEEVNGKVTAEAQRVTLLTGRVGNVEGTQTAQGSAISNLQTVQTSQGNTLTSHSQQLVSVQSSITTLDGRTIANANATTALDSRVSINEQGIAQAKSTWGVYLTAGNVISGVQSINDGVIAEFNVMAHVFRVMSPAGSPDGMEWRNGYLRTWGGAAQAVIGSGFGADDLMLFLGPNVGASNATKQAAGLWADSAGNVGMSGTVESSLLKTSALSIESTRISTGGGRLAPFTLRDVSYRTLGSTVASMTQTVDEFVSPNWGTGYHPRRFAAHRMDVHIDVQVSGDKGTETCAIEVQYDGGAWNAAASVTMDCNYRGSFPMLLRYTTEDAWSTVAFRARTSQAHTQALSIRVEVMNYNASANAPGSTSGTASTGGGGGSLPPGGGGWCVDAETSVLPDGRFVRDLRTGDFVPCWNDDPETPAIVMLPVRAVALGEEDCFELVTASGARLIQSRSTPMTLRDGRTAYTPDMLGEDVVVCRGGALEWETVVALARKGVREVVKLNAGDRMYFAGTDPALTIATHNMAKSIQLV